MKKVLVLLALACLLVASERLNVEAASTLKVVASGGTVPAGCDSQTQSTSANDLIVIQLVVNGTAYAITSPTDTGIPAGEATGAWTLRATVNGGSNVQLREYYLIVPAGGSHWRFGCTAPSPAFIGLGWVDISGESIAAPFDVGASFPATAGAASGTATWALTTNNSNDVMIGFAGSCAGNTVIQLTTNGFTGFGAAGNLVSNCSTSIYGDGGYKVVSTTQTLTPSQASGTDAGWATISDAVKAPPSITMVAPTSGPTGTNVTVSGSNFQGLTTVTFQSSGMTFHVTNDTTLTIIIASGNGPGDIRLDNSAPIPADQFDLIAGRPPPSGGGGCCGPPLFITPPITNKTQIQPSYALTFPDVSSIPFLQLYALISLPLLGGYGVAYVYGYRFDPYRLRWVRHPKQFKPKTAKIRFT